MKKAKYAFSLPSLGDTRQSIRRKYLFLQAKCSVCPWNLSQNPTAFYVWISSSCVFVCEILNMHGPASVFMIDLTECNPSTFQVYTL